MKRITFDPNAERPPAVQERRGNLCAAHGCRLAGDGADKPDSRDWWCSYHRSAPTPEEIPIVTEALRQHAAVVDVINDGQTLLNRQPFEAGKHAQYWQVNREALELMGYIVPPAKRPQWENCEGWLYRVRSMLMTLIRNAVEEHQAQARRNESRMHQPKATA